MSYDKRIGRTLPPAAAPIYLRDIAAGIRGYCGGKNPVAQFQQELRSHFQVRHCFLVSSGKTALTVILLALRERFPDKDEVLIPAFTCYSVPSAIVRAGLKVTLCDIDRSTLDFDYEQLSEKLSNPRLLCVIPTHLFGLPADIARLRHLLGGSAIPVVEDAAQAMGSEWNGKKLGTLGDVGFFSLGRGKALSTVEGGVIITDCDRVAGSLAAKIRELAEYKKTEQIALLVYALILMVFLRPSLFWIPKTLPFLKLGDTVFDPDFRMRKMSMFQAGLASGWQKKLDRLKADRTSAAREWMRILPQAVQLKGVRKGFFPLLRFPVMTASVAHTRHMMHESTRTGLGVSMTYPGAINTVAALSESFEGQDFPIAREAAARTVTLPLHCYVSQGDREKTIELIRGVDKQA